MALTPETLPRHELNGLPVRVVDSDDADRIGLEGRVVLETAKTLSVETRENGASRVVMVPKSGSVFEFTITDDAAEDAKSSGTASEPNDGEDVAYVTVDGSRLLSRPARRTETSGDSPWQ